MTHHALPKVLRIGTRDSALARWQADQVAQKLREQNVDCEIVGIKSPGDLDLETPLHEFGTTGIFTKVLDYALLENRVDIAVHSLKDYPTESPAGLIIPAVLDRGPHSDILALRQMDTAFLEQPDLPALIATGSIRRIAQWKHRYPHHQTTGLRGNVQTRLRKLRESEWQGAIFARAGLQRLDLLPKNFLDLEWMIPAPAQGVIGVGCREDDQAIIALLKQVNHAKTYLRAKVERDFLNQVEGGCSAPVGALAKIKGDNIYLEAAVFSLDGREKIASQKDSTITNATKLGRNAADEVLQNGGRAIMESLRNG